MDDSTSNTITAALDPFHMEWSADVIREHANLDEFDSFEAMTAARTEGMRITSAVAVFEREDGTFQLMAFRPNGNLVLVAAANAAEFALASWKAHGCPKDEAEAIAAGKRLAGGG